MQQLDGLANLIHLGNLIRTGVNAYRGNNRPPAFRGNAIRQDILLPSNSLYRSRKRIVKMKRNAKKSFFKSRIKARRRNTYNRKAPKYKRKSTKIIQRRNKDQRFNINKFVGKQETKKIITHADSFTYPSFLKITFPTNNDQTGEVYRNVISRTLIVNSSQYLINQNNQINSKQPTNATFGYRLDKFDKFRINYAVVTVKFQVYGNYDGYAYLLPCMHSSEETTGNGRNTLTTSGNQSYSYFTWNSAHFESAATPALTTDNIHMQSIIKKVRIRHTQEMAPSTYTLKVCINCRDSMNLSKDEYATTKSTFMDIDKTNLTAKGYQLPPNDNIENANEAPYRSMLSYGLTKESGRVGVDDNTMVRVSIKMKQYVQLQDPKRIVMPTDHPVI